MKTLAIFILLLLLLSGCSSYREVSVPDVVTRVVHDTVSNTRELHDSTYVYDAILPLDSTTISKYFPQLADVITPLPLYGEGEDRRSGVGAAAVGAVHLERRLVLRHDSVFTHRIDSVPYKVEVVKEVARKRNWFDWMCYGITGFIVLVIILYIVKRLSVF